MNRKVIADREMAHFDRLAPQWRELVREYNFLPRVGETFESYKARARLSNRLGIQL